MKAYPKLVHYHFKGVLHEFGQQRLRLLWRQMLEAALDDSAPIRVPRDVDDTPAEDADEVEVGRRHDFKDLLNDLDKM